MLTVADMGGGGVKNGQKSADVLYGRSLGVFKVLSSLLRDMKIIVFKVFDLQLEKGLKFSLKTWVFGTLDFMLIAAVE